MITQINKPPSTLLSLKFDVTQISEIKIFEEALIRSLADSKGTIHEMCNHLLSAGGKRIRPLLVIYSGHLFSREKNNLLKVAMAAELIHMASLVHDDIIDNSSLRRNKSSINDLWGNNHAVLCGDYLFAKAFELLSDNSLLPCMKYMVHAIQCMCHGEIQQASDKYIDNIDLDTYYDRIAKKTAIFIECCCKSGALISGADTTQVDLISQYGLNMGYAFQIIDDILDFCGNSNVMGKPIGEDLKQGNITLPIILLMKDNSYGDWIRQLLKDRTFSIENLGLIKLALDKTGVIKETYGIALAHIETAKKALALLPKSEYNNLLFNLADILQSRAN